MSDQVEVTFKEDTKAMIVTAFAFLDKRTTRRSVNYAKEWLDHSFLFPGLVQSEKEFYFGYDH